MSRGGRRRAQRRGSRDRPVADAGSKDVAKPRRGEAEGGVPPGGPPDGGGELRVNHETEPARASGLKTLPPDGLVLEDVISTMQREYGVPTTPQEYRLVLRAQASDPNATPEPFFSPGVGAGEPGRLSSSTSSVDAAGKRVEPVARRRAEADASANGSSQEGPRRRRR